MWFCNAVVRWQNPSAELNEMFAKVRISDKGMSASLIFSYRFCWHSVRWLELSGITRCSAMAQQLPSDSVLVTTYDRHSTNLSPFLSLKKQPVTPLSNRHLDLIRINVFVASLSHSLSTSFSVV